MLDALKRELKELIGASRHDMVFARLKESLNSSCRIYNDVILIQSSFADSERAAMLDLVDPSTQKISFNRVNQALLRSVDAILPEDLNASYRKKLGTHQCIPLYHAYTCDRVEQNEMFQGVYYGEPPEKIRFFFLYGDARQGHSSLVERLGYEIGGHLLNWEEGNYDPGVRIKFVRCKPQVYTNPILYQINIIRELLAKFIPQVNSLQPILQRKLSEVLSGAELNGMGAGDFVFVLLTIDDNNWNEKLTPTVVKNLIEGFCKCDLPPDAPSFFFFFGIEYKSENAVVKEQVGRVIEQREPRYGTGLPELLPVTPGFVEEWFSRYPLLLPADKSQSDMPKLLFGDSPQLNMINIINTLEKLISDHNNGLVIRTENFK